jgi:hypothetical protein
MTKKQPPEPPRRQSSSSSVDQMSNHFDALNISQTSINFQQQTAYYLHNQHHMLHQQAIHPNNQHLLHSQSLTHQIVPHQFNQPFYSNFVGHTHQTTVEVHAEKSNDSKSNSSIDSIDTLPFANENAGTIKQRVLNRQELTSSLSSSSSSSSSSATTIAGQQIIINPVSLSTTNSSSTTPNGGNGSIVPLTGSIQQQSNQSSPTLSASSMNSNCKNGGGNNTNNMLGSNVLNDIGHMLANLTDELDAMLEEEKRAGLNMDSD